MNECFSPGCTSDRDASVHTMTAAECDALSKDAGVSGCSNQSEHHTFVEVPDILTLDTVFMGDSMTLIDTNDAFGTITITVKDSLNSGPAAVCHISPTEARRLRDWLNARA